MQAEEAHRKQAKRAFEKEEFESDDALSSIRKASSRRKRSNGSKKLKMAKDGSMRLSNEVHN